MADNPPSNRRRNTIIAIAILIIIALLLLLTQCPKKKTPSPSTPAPSDAPPGAQAPIAPTTPPPSTPEPAEVLTPATITAPAQVPAGAAFTLTWTGPDNKDDYITIVRIDAPADAFASYLETRRGPSLELTAPIEPGPHELRYIASKSRTILGRAAIEVTPIAASLTAPAEVVLGAPFAVTWTGPNNKDDYITIVEQGAPDDKFGSYTNTSKGSPLTITAPVTTGDAEVRYVASQGRKVLARHAIKVIPAEITMSAPESAIAGSTISIAWTGPNNTGDYITIVTKETPDGQYGNYTNTATGSPLKLLTPIMDGAAELRYMTGQGSKVLARRAITIAAAQITLSAPPEAAANSDVSITWTGPNNRGDYITIVAKSAPDGQYGAYTNTTYNSPLNVKAPKVAGEAEVRYMTGQGNKVLARIPIKIVP